MRLAAKAQFGAKIYPLQSKDCRLAASQWTIPHEALDFKAVARRERDFNIFIHNPARAASRAGTARLREHPSMLWRARDAAERLPVPMPRPA